MPYSFYRQIKKPLKDLIQFISYRSQLVRISDKKLKLIKLHLLYCLPGVPELGELLARITEPLEPNFTFKCRLWHVFMLGCSLTDALGWPLTVVSLCEQRAGTLDSLEGWSQRNRNLLNSSEHSLRTPVIWGQDKLNWYVSLTQKNNEPAYCWVKDKICGVETKQRIFTMPIPVIIILKEDDLLLEERTWCELVFCDRWFCQPHPSFQKVRKTMVKFVTGAVA